MAGKRGRKLCCLSTLHNIIHCEHAHLTRRHLGDLVSRVRVHGSQRHDGANALASGKHFDERLEKLRVRDNDTSFSLVDAELSTLFSQSRVDGHDLRVVVHRSEEGHHPVALCLGIDDDPLLRFQSDPTEASRSVQNTFVVLRIRKPTVFVLELQLLSLRPVLVLNHVRLHKVPPTNRIVIWKSLLRLLKTLKNCPGTILGTSLELLDGFNVPEALTETCLVAARVDDTPRRMLSKWVHGHLNGAPNTGFLN